MNYYSPHRWVVIKLPENAGYKVLGGWNGGYLDSDEWRLNSGIEHAEAVGDYYVFYGYSGSRYTCHKHGYGVTSMSGNILNKLIERGAVEMDENTDWLGLDYGVENA